MGELQQRYQQRLGDVSKSHNVQPEVKFLVESLRAELEGKEHLCKTVHALCAN